MWLGLIDDYAGDRPQTGLYSPVSPIPGLHPVLFPLKADFDLAGCARTDLAAGCYKNTPPAFDVGCSGRKGTDGCTESTVSVGVCN